MVVQFELVPVPDSARGKFSDTLDIDSDHRLLYMGDNWSGGVDVFDISSAVPGFLRTIKLRGRIYGLVVAGNVNKLFAGMSGSTLAAISINSEKNAVTLIHTGGVGHVDLLDYDSEHRRVFSANRVDGFLTSLDAVTTEITGRVDGLGHGLEQPRFNRVDGMVYLTDNVENVLYQIDPDRHRLVETFSLAEPCFPNGMAINPQTNQAVLACSNRETPRTLVWDLTRQEIITVIEDCGGADGVIYEPSIDRFLVASSGSSGGPVIGILGGDPVRLLAKVRTAQDASWVGFDSERRVVYAVAVDNGKPAVLSFHLREV